MGKLTPVWKSACLRQSCTTLWTGYMGSWEGKRQFLKGKLCIWGLCVSWNTDERSEPSLSSLRVLTLLPAWRAGSVFPRFELHFHPLNKTVSLGNCVPWTYCFGLLLSLPLQLRSRLTNFHMPESPHFWLAALDPVLPENTMQDVRRLGRLVKRCAFRQTTGCRPALCSVFCWVCLLPPIRTPPFALEKLALRTNYRNAPHNELNSWLMLVDYPSL